MTENDLLIALPKRDLEKLQDALNTARNGLRWYQDHHTEDVNGSDDEANAEIDEALAILDVHLPEGVGCVYDEAKRVGAKL